MSTSPTPLARISAGDGVRWIVAEDAVAILFSGTRFLPDDAAVPRTVLRATRSRRIDRVDLPSGAVVVKTYVSLSAAEAIARRLAGRIPALDEFERARELARRGVPVAAPLAAGFRVRGGGVAESTLVTRFVPEGVDLLQLARVVGMRREPRNRLIGEAAALVRRLHDAGAAHHDLHLGNVMVEPGPPPQLVLVDVRRVRFGPPVSDEERWEQLAVLGRASFGVTSRSDRLRFLVRYLGESATGPARRALARRIEARAARLVGAHARERARSARRGDARFERIARGGVRWVVHRASGSPDLDRVLAGVEAAMTASGARTLKAGRSSTVVLAPPFVIKRFNLKKTRNLVLDVLRPSRALRTLARSILLGAHGIPTPPVLAAGEERRLGLVRRGYVVMEAVRDAMGLAEAVLSRRDGPALAASAGRLVAKLHALGLVHRDLKATNLLVDGRGGLVLVDLDGLGAHGRVMDGRAARDLGRLARDLRSGPRGAETVEALLGGYLEARAGVDRAVIRRAASD